MPCNSDYMKPTGIEVYAGHLQELLKETKHQRANYKDQRAIYNATQMHITEMTEKLCAWCKTHNVAQASLEMQIWWRDHCKADAETPHG